MVQAIYRDYYDEDSLYAQYDNRGMIAAEALEAIKARQARRSDDLRAGAERSGLVRFVNDGAPRAESHDAPSHAIDFVRGAE